MRNRSALAGVLAVSGALVLSGCGTGDMQAPSSSDKTLNTVRFGVAHLEDGRYVPCAVTSTSYQADISCDWENATTDSIGSTDGITLLSSLVTAPNGTETFCIATSTSYKAGLDCEWDSNR